LDDDSGGGDLQLLVQDRSRVKNIVITVGVTPEAAVVWADLLRWTQGLFNLHGGEVEFASRVDARATISCLIADQASIGLEPAETAANPP
jgi:hypothetical protein